MIAFRRVTRVLAAGGLSALLLAGSASLAVSETTITWGKPAEITYGDVHVAGTSASWDVFQLVYETLLTTDETLALQPGLAESWEQTSPTTYVFTLRPDAAFSNGRAVSPADVVGTFERILDPATASYWAKQFGAVKEIKALDEHRVQVELAEPHTAFLPAVAHISSAIIPIEELKAGTFDPVTEMLGSGPFMVSEHKQDESWTFAANPHYWREGYPLADTLYAPIIPDEAARMAALRDGRIDYTFFSNPDIELLLARDGQITVLPQETTNYYRVDVNALNPERPFHDKRLRQAMNLSLDRDAIRELVFAGSAPVDYPVPRAFGLEACKSTPAYALPRNERLEQARALLAEAGQPAPEVSIMATSSNALYGRIAQVMQQSMAEAGFKASIEQVPVADWLQRVFTDGDFDLSVSWLAGYTDPTMVISWWNPNFAIWNLAFFENVPALDDALTAVKQMPAGADRDAKLDEICEMIGEGANMLALVNKIDYVAYRNDQIQLRVAPKTGSSNMFQHIDEFKSLKP
ncbi:MAG: ABC transporter substrate-binding protein [Rhodospirillales bacterium]